MIIINKVLTFMSTQPVQELGIPWQLSTQTKLFFKMSAQVCSLPGQTEVREKAFLESKSIDLFYKLCLTCGCNVNNYKSVHHPIVDSKVIIHFLLWIKESNQSPNFETFKCLVKIFEIPRLIFETTSQFSIKFCINIQYHQT